MKTLKTLALLSAFTIFHAAASLGSVLFVDIVPDVFVNDPFFGDSDHDIDFNQDGTVDLRFVVDANPTNGFNAAPVLGTRIQSVPFGDPGEIFAYPMSNGDLVGPSPIAPATWLYHPTRGSILSVCGSSVGFCFGYFQDFFVGWVGVEFTLADGVHYGVVEIEGWFGNGFVRSYAWETSPGVPITAPEPGRMVLCVMGLGSLLIHRRRPSRSRASRW